MFHLPLPRCLPPLRSCPVDMFLQVDQNLLCVDNVVDLLCRQFLPLNGTCPFEVKPNQRKLESILNCPPDMHSLSMANFDQKAPWFVLALCPRSSDHPSLRGLSHVENQASSMRTSPVYHRASVLGRTGNPLEPVGLGEKGVDREVRE